MEVLMGIIMLVAICAVIFLLGLLILMPYYVYNINHELKEAHNDLRNMGKQIQDKLKAIHKTNDSIDTNIVKYLNYLIEKDQ